MSEFNFDTNAIVSTLISTAEAQAAINAMQHALGAVLRRNHEGLVATVEDNTQNEVNALTRQLGDSLSDLSQA